MTESHPDRQRGGLRFLLSRRWISYFVLLVIFAIACGFLSHWQFERRDWRLGENHKVIANFDAEPVTLEQALPQLDSFDPQQEWLPVAMRGEYLADQQLLARNRPYERQPGFEILTPFRTDSGEIFIVNRGWLPTGERGDLPDHIPAPPEGQVVLTARLKPTEPHIPGREAPAGQVPTIYLPGIAEQLGGEVYTGAYGLLRSESGDAETGTLTAKPEITEGNHLSYAVQWIIFAVIAAVGLIHGVRAEFRERNADDPRVQAAKQRERLRAQRRRERYGPSDAEIEDALIDEAMNR
ncbi:SURF1 family protein [Gulosibacter hominis]|uniref:SURF1 family cytochrome oxidase biogenesis protein n=1 Tax=Gulosibacter hominis TaxID=2770504 RepID=UPI001E451230|nr:SURF1 family protein [Gulosibacter hominis]